MRCQRMKEKQVLRMRVGEGGGEPSPTGATSAPRRLQQPSSLSPPPFMCAEDTENDTALSSVDMEITPQLLGEGSFKRGGYLKVYLGWERNRPLPGNTIGP